MNNHLDGSKNGHIAGSRKWGTRQFVSAQLIIDSFIDLLEKYSFEDISITQICSKATVSRNTFYRLFSGKYDIIEAALEHRTREISLRNAEKDLFVTNEGEKYDQVKAYSHAFESWKNEHRLLRILESQGLFSMVHDSLSRNMQNAYVEHLIEVLEQKYPPSVPYFIPLHAAILYGILQVWTCHNFQETPEELSRIILSNVKESFLDSIDANLLFYDTCK